MTAPYDQESLWISAPCLMAIQISAVTRPIVQVVSFDWQNKIVRDQVLTGYADVQVGIKDWNRAFKPLQQIAA